MSPRAQILVAALLFGTTGTAQALAGVEPPLAVGSARIVVGGTALAAVAVLRGELRGLGGAWRLVVVAALGVAGYQLAFFAAVAATGVAVGTVVAIGLATVVTGALEWAIEGTAPPRRWIAATTLAVAGVALLAVAASADAAIRPAGIALAVAAAIGYALYAVVCKRLLRLGHAPGGVMGASFGLAGLLLVPALVVAGPAHLASPAGLGLALYLGLLPTAAAYLLYARGLRRVTAGETTTIGLAEPLAAAVLGAAVLHEALGAPALAGGGLVLAGLLALTVPVPPLRPAKPVLSEP
jgi:DME family drug/metabolite transporter